MSTGVKRFLPLVLNVALLAGWCVFIFCMSAANGDLSQSYSDGFSASFLAAIDPSFASLEPNEKLQRLSGLSFPVRKAAHFSEYLVLGVLAANFARLSGNMRGQGAPVAALLFSWAFCVLFAFTDEFHQLFIDGRSSQLFDVAVDSIGALAGVLVLAACVRRLSKK